MMKELNTHEYRLRNATVAALLGAGLAFASVAMVAAQGLSEEETEVALANFKDADADRSGSLTPEEFKTFIDANAAARLGRAKRIKLFGAYGRAFSRLDEDKNGTVTWAEFLSVAG